MICLHASIFLYDTLSKYASGAARLFALYAIYGRLYEHCEGELWNIHSTVTRSTSYDKSLNILKGNLGQKIWQYFGYER